MNPRDSLNTIGGTPRAAMVPIVALSFGAIVAAIILGLAPLRADETPVTRTTLLSAAATDETKASIAPNIMGHCRESAVYVEWSSGVASGVVQVESAFSSGYGGTWAPLATVTFSGAAPHADIVQITGVHGALQTRISTAVSGGTVTTRLVCN